MFSKLRVAVIACVTACAPSEQDCWDAEDDCKLECEDSFDRATCIESCTADRDDCLDEVYEAEDRAEVAGGILELLAILFDDDDDD